MTRFATAAAELPAPETLPDGPYVTGLAGPSIHAVHAIPREDAEKALAACGRGGQAYALPVCLPGYRALVTPRWGQFDRSNWRLRRACPACAWTVALRSGTTAAELDALRPAEAEREVLRRVLGRDESLAVRLAEAVLASAVSGEAGELDPWDPQSPVELLAAISAHAPAVLAPVDCWELDCGHERVGDGALRRCSLPTARAACRSCSVFAGGWASEGLFRDECTVLAPCGVLRALARWFGLHVNTSAGVR